MLEPVAALLAVRLPTLTAAYVFGSTARGDARPDSDLDVAVLAAAPVARDLLWSVSEDLALAVSRDVDLVDLRDASTVLAAQIIATGKVFIDRSPEARRAFEGRAYADYARLNEERREILKAVAARGTIYG